MPRPFHGALLCALVSACRSPGPAPREHALASSAQPGAAPSRAEVSAEAARLIEAGRLEEARAMLDELLLSGSLDQARAQLDAGAPADALTIVDRVLELAPEDREARLLKADASLAFAERELATGAPAAGIEGALDAALQHYRGLDENAHTLLGASRAAWRLGNTQEALALARRGMSLRKEDDRGLRSIGLVPERIYAEEVVAAHASARAESSEDAGALFREAEEALGKLLGRAGSDPWVWANLADVYERENALAEARGACERGLARVPTDPGLLERFARVSGAHQGLAATVRAFERYV